MELEFEKSSYSSSAATCVEIADAPDRMVVMRDSKNADRPDIEYIHLAPEAFTAFIGGLAVSEFTYLNPAVVSQLAPVNHTQI